MRGWSAKLPSVLAGYGEEYARDTDSGYPRQYERLCMARGTAEPRVALTASIHGQARENDEVITDVC